MEIHRTIALSILIAFICISHIKGNVKKDDPCLTYKPFPNAERRDVPYELDQSETPLSDQYIEEGWYGSKSMEIVTKSPGAYKCGTFFPVWAKQEVPNGKEFRVTMCTDTPGGQCADPFSVRAIKCNTHRIYFLKRTSSDSAYCLSASDKSTIPQSPEAPEVVVDLVKVNKNRELSFHCRVKRSQEDLFYRIYWYIDNKHITTSEPQKWDDIQNMKNRLDESTIQANGWKSVGFNIHCSVRVSREVLSAASPPISSQEKFIGIKLLNTTVNLGKDPVDVFFQLTAPFGCFGDKECKLYVQVLDTHRNQGEQCQSKVLGATDCGTTVTKSDWNKTQKITIKPRINVKVTGYIVTTSTLKLATAKRNYNHAFWKDYQIGNIQVHSEEDSSSIHGKMCQAFSDPHIKTMNGRPYEHHYDGTFTLYTHTELPIEVQVETTHCYGNSHVRCVCGVAVRAGRSVFAIHKCRGIRRQEFTLCDDDDDVLDVRKRDINQYEILTPSGAIVKVNIHYLLMNVNIVPSVLDHEKSRGLCGKLSKTVEDELVLRDGKQTPDANARSRDMSGFRNRFPFFSESWRVDDHNNLFDKNTFHRLSKWDSNKNYCSCQKKNCNHKPPCETVECGPMQERQFCQTNLPKTKVRARPSRCKFDLRKKRSAHEPKPISFETSKDVIVEKRDTNGALNGWTSDKAKTFCEERFAQTPSIAACRDIPTVNITSSIEQCVFDIMATGVSGFVAAAIDAIQSKCIQEVTMNSSYHESNGTESILEHIIKSTCPNGCTGHGNCTDGVCRCVSGYSGPDCSVDLSSPPVITEVEDGGLCDINTHPFTEISVYGDTFVDSSDVTCKFREIHVNGNIIYDANHEHVVTANVESAVELICPVPVPRQKRSALGAHADVGIRAYYLSVSNNGVVYSKDSIVVIYNSTCQACDIHTSVNCTVLGEYCAVGGKCVPRGGKFPLGECLVCDIQGGERTWQHDENDHTCGSMKPSSQWILLMMLSAFVILGFFTF